jgi:hypothetical protein
MCKEKGTFFLFLFMFYLYSLFIASVTFSQHKLHFIPKALAFPFANGLTFLSESSQSFPSTDLSTFLFPFQKLDRGRYFHVQKPFQRYFFQNLVLLSYPELAIHLSLSKSSPPFLFKKIVYLSF